MNPALLIARKRDGHALTADQIGDLIHGYCANTIPDYQMSSLCMAICLRGMTAAETLALTEHMLHSGATLRWPSAASRTVVDKHSTGGVGDKVSLVLAPLLACVGLAVPMISGRGLGPTGGTLDKLESIEGFRTDLSARQLQQQTEQVGCAITGATAEIAPADQKLYALRDVTGTVPSIPLITASILSKKLAEGLAALVLDIKCGGGAFMKTEVAARELAQSLVETSSAMGVRTTAFLSDMNQPLGCAVGNALEVEEALATLRGGGPGDLRELTLTLAGELMIRSGLADSQHDAAETLRRALDSGAAMTKFADMVQAQGGDLERLPKLSVATDIVAPCTGFVTRIDTEALAIAVIELGGGRRVQTDKIDHRVGLKVLRKLGDPVERRQPILRLFGHAVTDEIIHRLEDVVEIEDQPSDPVPLIYDVLRSPPDNSDR